MRDSGKLQLPNLYTARERMRKLEIHGQQLLSPRLGSPGASFFYFSFSFLVLAKRALVARIFLGFWRWPACADGMPVKRVAPETSTGARRERDVSRRPHSRGSL